jgi:hypothetical protein
MNLKAEKRTFPKITTAVFTFWFFLVPFFWHFDISRGAYGFYDFFISSPYSLVHLIVFYILGAISVLFNRLSLYHVVLFAMYFPMIQLSNYPYLTIRDVYLHAAPTKSIVANGNLIYSNNSEVGSWPGSFCLHGIVTIILGCDLVTANYILYCFSVMVVAIFIYISGRLFQNKGFKCIWPASLLFLGLFFNHLFDNFHHYSRTSLAFTLLFVFFFVFVRIRSRRGLLLKFLLVFSILVTHPFQSLALVAFLFAYSVLNFKVKSSEFALFSVVGFVGWMLFQGSSTFSEAVSRLTSFLSPQYVKPIAETLPTKETLPWLGILLREYFKYSFLGLFGGVMLASIILVLFKRDKLDFITVSLLSFSFSSVVMLLGLLMLPDWQIARFTPFAAFPIAFSSFLLIEKFLKESKFGVSLKIHRLLSPTIFATLSLIFVVSLSATVTVLRFERNYYFGEMYHPTEMSSLSFLFKHDTNSTITTISWRTSVYSIYFNDNLSHKVLRIWYLDLKEFGSNVSKIIFVYNQLIDQSRFVIRGLRDNYTLGGQVSGDSVLRALDDEMILKRFALIYSNNYYFIYERANF